MSPARDYAAELTAARKSGDWDAHARIWEERRAAEVDADEAAVAGTEAAGTPEGFIIVDQESGLQLGPWYHDFDTARTVHDALVAAGGTGLRVVRFYVELSA